MTEVQIDFMVPASLGGAGRRGARLGVHGTEFARKATGLEAAVVDHALVRVGALDPTDARAFDLRVAGIGALMLTSGDPAALPRRGASVTYDGQRGACYSAKPRQSRG